MNSVALTRLAEWTEGAVDYPQFDADVQILSAMETAHGVEAAEVQAAIHSLEKEEGAFEHEVHAYILGHMDVAHTHTSFAAVSAPATPAQAPMEGADNAAGPPPGYSPLDSEQIDSTAVLLEHPPCQELAALRHVRATLTNKASEKGTIMREHVQHEQEYSEVFPVLRNRVGQESALWVSEKAAVDLEAGPRLGERVLYTSKVEAQEVPVDGVLNRQALRSAGQDTMEAGFSQRASDRDGHYLTIQAIHTNSANRVQPRAQRNMGRAWCAF
jgi:hypothetical protein